MNQMIALNIVDILVLNKTEVKRICIGFIQFDEEDLPIK